jgi:hypothetical protein
MLIVPQKSMHVEYEMTGLFYSNQTAPMHWAPYKRRNDEIHGNAQNTCVLRSHNNLWIPFPFSKFTYSCDIKIRHLKFMSLLSS